MPIVITQAYVLQLLGAAGNPKHPHIGYQTWVRDLIPDDISASSETQQGPKGAVIRPDTHEFWQGNAMPAIITIDLGQARPVDYVGIAGHTIGTEGATTKVEYSSDGVNFTQFSNSLTPSGDVPIMFLDSAVSRRYWRITLSGSVGIPKIAVIYIGQVLAMPRSIYGGHSPAPLSRDTKLFQNFSDGGQFLGQYIRRQGVVGTVNFKHLQAAWYRQNFDPFVKAARQFPFFLAWRPETFPNEIAYGWTDTNIKPSNMGTRDLMQVQFNFKGLGYAD